MLIGTLLSPYIFDSINYYGCYGLAISFNALVLAYFLFAVKEIPKTDVGSSLSVSELKSPPPYNQNGGTINGDAKLENGNNRGTATDRSWLDAVRDIFKKYVYVPILTLMLLPCYEMIKVLIRRRQGRLQFLIFLIILTYALFWFAVEEMLMQYNYLVQAFPGFDGDDMSKFSTTSYSLSKY